MKFPQVLFFTVSRKIFLLFLFLTASGWLTAAFGQIKAARSEMEEFNYTKAIEILHQFIQKADPKTKAEATLLMADCYRLENDMQDARAWYLKAIKLGRTEPLTYFYYAKALRACGDYEAAKKIFLKYDSLMPGDQRGKIYASFCDSAIAWDEKPFAFEVNNARSLNSSNTDFGPIFYNDGIMFVTDRIMSPDDKKKNELLGKGYMQLVFARPKQKEEFYGDYTMPRPVPELFTNGSDDGPATFSEDGNEVFITRTEKFPDKEKAETTEGPVVQLKIFTATKTGDKWSKMKPFFFNNPKYSVGYPALSPDGNSLYFISDVDGGQGGMDLYVSSRDGSVWNPPSNLGPIVNTFGNELFPFMAMNGDLYFASDGHPGYGGLDIFVTRKVGNVWLLPQNLGKPINSSYDDFALAMYNNDSIGLFSANRPGGRGEDDIYSFRVVGPLPQVTYPALPVIAANVPPKEESKPAEKPVPAPAPAIAEVKPPVEQPKQEVKPEQKAPPKEEAKPVENIVPVPAPAVAEVKPPVEQPKEEVKPEEKAPPKEEPKPVENIVPVPAPAVAEVKPPVEQPKEEVKSEQQAPPKEEAKPVENIVPVPAPAVAEVKPPVEQPKEEVKTEQQAPPKEEAKPVENIVPVPAPAVAEVKPPVEQPKEEIKPEQQPAPKEEVKPTENIVPVPAPSVAEVKPPVEQPKEEVKPEQQAPPKEEVKPIENIVPVPAPAIAEVKPPVEQPKEEVKPEQQAAPKEEAKPVENIVPAPAPIVAEVKPPVEQPKEEVKPEQQPAPKEEVKPTENIVPVPAPVVAEVKPPAEQPKEEVKPEQQAPPQEEGKPVENVVSVPAPAVAEVKPPVEQPKEEVKPEQQAPPKEEAKPVENVVPAPAPAVAEVKPPAEEPKQEIKPEQVIATVQSGKSLVSVSGCVKDLASSEPVAEATVFVLDENQGRVVVHKAGSNGCFSSELATGNRYLVKAMKTGYYSDCLPFGTDTIGNRNEIKISGDLLLDRVGAIHTYAVDNIYYDFDKYFIRSDAVPVLNKLVRIMTSTPVTVEMGSHADCRGSFEYNMGLTQRRANSAMSYVVNKGISASRITSKWYGKTRLVNNCDCSTGVHCTEAEHQMNRRTEFRISLSALNLTETSVDLDRYHEGDTLELRVLPVDFFRNCAHKDRSGVLAEVESIFNEPAQKVYYTVQIGAFSFIRPHFNNLNDVMSCKSNDGILRCFVGKFTSKTEAIWFRDHLRAREFKDAFVTPMDEKHQPGNDAQEQKVMAKNR